MKLRLALVTNFAQYYRVPVYEDLARYFDTEFFFFSRGDEGYWLPQHGVASGSFRVTQVDSRRVLGTAVAPSLIPKLWRGNFDVYLSGIVGRFTLPATYLVARLRRRPFVLWTQIWMRIDTRAHRLFFPVTRYFYRHADAIVAGGEHVKRYLIAEGVAAERIFSCGNATDNALYQREVTPAQRAAQRRRLGLTDDEPVILYVGRIEEAKGLHVLLDAFAALDRPAVRLLIAGSGLDPDYEQRLHAQVERLGLAARVVFAGYVPNTEVPELYALAQFSVVPSITTATFKEPWGLIVNEAFGQGTPVIASDCVGAAAGGMLVDGVQGLVVPEGNVDALTAAMQRLLDDDALRTRMSAAARSTLPEWDVARMVLGFRRAIEYAAAPKGTTT